MTRVPHAAPREAPIRPVSDRPSGNPPPAGARRALVLDLLPVLAALLLRLLLLPLARSIPDAGDSVAYVGMAREFLRNGSFVDLAVGVRPPLFRVLVALGLDGSKHPYDPWPGSFLLQIACDVLACWLVLRLARALFSPRAGRCAAWIYALFPTVALYASIMIMAESAAFALLAAALLQLAHFERALDGRGGGPRRPALLLGLLLGVGILTKEVFLPVTAVVALALVLRFGPRRAGLAAGVLFVALAVTTPWIVRNLRLHGLPVVSSTATDLVLMHGNMPPSLEGRSTQTDGMQRWSEIPTLREKVHTARRVFANAFTDYPELTAERAWTRLRVLLGPEIITPTWIAHFLEGLPVDAPESYRLMIGSWRLPADTWGRIVQIACGLGTIVLFGLAAAGLALARPGVHRTLALWLPGLLTLAFMLTWSESRYRLILVPLFVPFAGLALDRLLAAWRHEPDAPADEGHRAERAGLLVALLFLLTIFVLPPPPVP